MSALANCSHCTFFAKVTREKCFCWQALRNGRTLCIISSCFFKQCENSVKIFHRRVFSPTSCSQSALQHGTVGDVPRRIVQLQVELSRYLPGSSLLAASLLGSQFGLCLPASRWNFTNLEGSISFNENGNCAATWQEVACLSLWVQQTLSTVWAVPASDKISTPWHPVRKLGRK